jgi:5-methylcytosine-specific restriction endonuclease McrA
MNCPTCGGPLPPPHQGYQRVYCSGPCRTQATLVGRRKVEHIKLVCAWCRAPFERIPSLVKNQTKVFCSGACRQSEEASRTITFNCAQCGKACKRPQSNVHTKGPYFCSRLCDSRYHTADRHARWVGGTKRYRGANWKEQRKKALKRDKHTCQHCGAKTKLVVHHKTPYRINHDSSLKNLIVLCSSCHLKADDAWRRAYPVNQLRLL